MKSMAKQGMYNIVSVGQLTMVLGGDLGACKTSVRA